MRKILQRLLTKPVVQLADKLSSRPDKKRVNKALTHLYDHIKQHPGKKGLDISFNTDDGKFIILSDQHKGARDGADVFAGAENNYLAALAHYDKEKFFYINIGDSEELWENLFITVEKHNKATFDAEKKFISRNAFIKIFGNHDLYWDNDPLASVNLEKIYGEKIPIYEGVILKTNNKKSLEIYMTHGHQGDLQSDGNWFSKWFVSDIWGPFQAYLRINPNTPANNNQLKTTHNKMMYEWSSKRKNMLLITGHTHQPVFKSFTHLELLMDQLAVAKRNREMLATVEDLQRQIQSRENKGDQAPSFTGYLDTYFNTGCCCFDDGDITGIELENGYIRLIKWHYGTQKKSERIVLEESKLSDLKID